MSRGVIVLAWALQGCGLAADRGGEVEPAARGPEPAGAWAADTREEPRASRALAPDRASLEEPGPAGQARTAPVGQGPSLASACSGAALGSFDYCSTSCPCSASQGDCDSDAQCTAGNVCMRDTGGLFGFDPELDVCMEECSPDALGTPDFCSPTCPCEAGQGDCDDDEDCGAGDVCAQNVGASFGFAADVDVCVDACDPVFNGTFDYCGPGCPCEHGQGDCDGDGDCAPGHVCARDVGARYGFDPEMDMCEAVQHQVSGRVIDEHGKGEPSVRVWIGSVITTTSSTGDFSLQVPPSQRHMIYVAKTGYVPQSRVHAHIGAEVSGLVFILRRAERIPFDPREPVDITDSRGTRLVLPANALVDANGLPPDGWLTAYMHTYALREDELLGNMEALDENGDAVLLGGLGAAYIEVVDADGREYQIDGPLADITLQLPGEDNFNGPIPMWHYDYRHGEWYQEGMGMLENTVVRATVTHLAVWAVGIKIEESSCLRVVVPDELLPSGGSIRARIESPPPFFRWKEVNLERGSNVLFNLRPFNPINLFVPADAATPLATLWPGAPWGGMGVPPAPYSVCGAELRLPVDLPGAIVGVARLQGGTHERLEVVVRSADGSVVATGSVDEHGWYRVEVPPGDYNVDLGHAGHLRVEDAGWVNIASGETSYLPCLQLVAGDVNGDDRIDDVDRALVQAAQGSSAGPGDPLDLDGDGVVDIHDVGLVRGNQGYMSPPFAEEMDLACPSGEVRSVVAGGTHTCATLDGGRVRCWGNNAYGQLGYNNTANIGDDETLLLAPNVRVGTSAHQVALGRGHTCVVRSNNDRVRCWGDNDFGQLGYGHSNDIGDDETPATAGTSGVNAAVAGVVAGGYHTCAVMEVTGNLRCWGYNAYGQLGYGHTLNISDGEGPDFGGNVPVGGEVLGVAAGNFHMCALTAGGVRCWGHNDSGQLGYGHRNNIGDNETPASVGYVNLGGTAVALVAGAAHTCALLDDGRVKCWGSNFDGQLGYGHERDIGDNETPASVGYVDVGGPVLQLAAGARHTCALLSGGRMRCWGRNTDKQLGYGHRGYVGDDETPASAGDVDVGGVVVQISAGALHTCVQLDTGRVRCWGSNTSGELGYGHTNRLGTFEPAIMAGEVPFL